MSERAKSIALLALLLVFLMVLFPPWQGQSYSIVFAPPTPSSEIDLSRLCFQLILVAIACGAISLSLPATAGDVGAGEQPLLGDKRLRVVLLVISLSIVVPIGWNLLREYRIKQAIAQAAEAEARKQQIAEKQQLERLKIANAEGYRRDAERRRLAEEQRQSLQAQQRALWEQAVKDQQERKLQLAKLAKPRVWKVGGRQIVRVTPLLHTSWKEGQLIYCLELTGEPDALEYVTGTNPSIIVVLKSSDGSRHRNLYFNLHGMGARRTKSGGIRSLISEHERASMSEEEYVRLRGVSLN